MKPSRSELGFASLVAYCPRKGVSAAIDASQRLMVQVKENRVLDVRGHEMTTAEYVALRLEEIAPTFTSTLLGKDAALVPVPRSSLQKTGALWPAKELAVALHARGFGAGVLPCLKCEVAVPKAATSAARDRPKAGTHCDSLTVLKPFMFAFGLREGHVREDPFEKRIFRSLKLKEPRGKPNALTLSPTQVDAFLERADVMSPAAYAALFRVTAGSGLRIDEARHLEDRDIDTSRRVLTVTPKKGWTTKGYRYRDVPISERTAAAGRTFIQLREKVALDDKSVWKEIHRVREGTTLPKFSMHDLRRAWASAMHANGATLKQISVWLGHADIATTEKYIRVFGGETTGHEFLPR